MNHSVSYIYLSFLDSNYSRSGVLVNAPKIYSSKIFSQVSSRTLKAIIQLYKLNKLYEDKNTCFVVMSPCHKLVPLVRLVSRKHVVLDAGWLLLDGHLSRNPKIKLQKLPEMLKIWLIDIIAFHLADMVFVESEKQKIRISKNLRMSNHDIFVSYTSLNELPFRSANKDSYDIRHEVNIESLSNYKSQIIFRGKTNNESGFNEVLKAAQMLPDYLFFLLIDDQYKKAFDLPKNINVRTNFSNEYMKEVYLNSDIAIGQYSNHPRLKFTIPHKAFEAAFFETAYVSADNPGIREIGDENSVYFIKEPTAQNLCEAIIKLSHDSELRSSLSKNFNLIYKKFLSQEITLLKFEETVRKTLYLNI